MIKLNMKTFYKIFFIIYTQQTQNICIPFIQLRLNVFDVGPALCK